MPAWVVLDDGFAVAVALSVTEESDARAAPTVV